jgi:hypothetical protein
MAYHTFLEKKYCSYGKNVAMYIRMREIAGPLKTTS